MRVVRLQILSTTSRARVIRFSDVVVQSINMREKRRPPLAEDGYSHVVTSTRRVRSTYDKRQRPWWCYRYRGRRDVRVRPVINVGRKRKQVGERVLLRPCRVHPTSRRRELDGRMKKTRERLIDGRRVIFDRWKRGEGKKK